MTFLLALALALTAVAATVVVLTDAPDRQAVTLSAFGMILVVLFVLLQAPDVALSELGVGTAIVPLLVMLTLNTMRKDRADRDSRDRR